MRNRIALTIFTLAALVVAAPAAGAATTIGSTMSGTANDAFACTGTCSIVQTALGSGTAAAPIDGVVVRWRVKTNAPGGPFGLRVAKPFTGSLLIGAGATGLETAKAAGINEFATRLPIRVGDNIGLTITAATQLNNVRYKEGVVTAGASTSYFDPQLPEGGSGTTPTNVNNLVESFFNADIEADADRDGFGDETQDRCIGVFGTSNGCDVTAPVPVLVSYSPQSVGSLKIKLSVNETANFEARATVSYKSKGKTKTIKSKLAKLSLTGTSLPTNLSLKFTSKQKKTLRALIKKGKKLSAKVSVTAADPSGNKATLAAKIKLKR
jgi:hypothetical protein